MRLHILVALPLAHGRCTAIGIDAEAAGGSGIAGMNADCSNCDGRVTFVPAKTNTEERAVYQFQGPAPRWIGYGRGKFYEPKGDEEPNKKMFSIPETEKNSFGYWEAILPLMNDQGLGLGESSCAATLMNYPLGQAPKDGKEYSEGILDITTLMQLALERCATALCAVKKMGALAEEYGFMPMMGEWYFQKTLSGRQVFADGGEALTVSDRKGDTYVFHVVGGVPGVTKSVWAAQKVPKGHVVVIANNFIIREIPDEPTDDFLYSSTIREAAKAAGLWSGEGPLHWTRVFAPNTVTVGDIGQPPIPLYTSLRTWGTFNLVQPSANWTLELDPLNYPFSIKAEKKMTHLDAQKLLSNLYEGTEFDMTAGILSGPFGNPFPSEGGPAVKFGQIPRGVSIARTVYSVVNEAPREGLATTWFCADTPATSVYVPFFPNDPEWSPYYSQGLSTKYSRDSAWWAFDFVANWAGFVNYHRASKEQIYPLKKELETQIENELQRLKEDDLKAVGKWAKAKQTEVVERWLQLGDELIVTYNDGFYNDFKKGNPGMGQKIGYPAEWARMVGFDNDVHPIYVKPNTDPAAYFAAHPDAISYRFVEPANPLPRTWEKNEWVYESPHSDEGAKGSTPHSAPEGYSLTWLLTTGLICVLLGASGGFIIRKSGSKKEGYTLMT